MSERIELENLQDSIVKIIQGIDIFSADAVKAFVLADDGLQNDKMEDALKGIGWCVPVSMPIAGNTKAQASAGSTSAANNGEATFDVLTVISVRTNPKKNTGENKIVVLLAVKKIIKALLSDKPTNGKKGFFLPDQRAFEPDYEDVGCNTYDIRVFRNVSI